MITATTYETLEPSIGVLRKSGFQLLGRDQATGLLRYERRRTFPPLPLVDHLVWGGRDLEQEIDRLQALTGVRATAGGRHLDQGTRNALIRLGPAMYLELIGPDLSPPPPPGPRWFGLDDLTTPRLITWAAKAENLEHRADAACRAGLELGEVRSGQRQQNDGRMLSWRLVRPLPLMAALAALWIMSAVPALAQDPVKVDPKHYTVEFENEQVRVLRISYGAGEKSVMHDHPNGVAVFLTDGQVKFTTPDGKSREDAAKAGSTQWAPGGKHLPENTGDKPFELILVELKGKSTGK